MRTPLLLVACAAWLAAAAFAGGVVGQQADGEAELPDGLVSVVLQAHPQQQQQMQYTTQEDTLSPTIDQMHSRAAASSPSSSLSSSPSPLATSPPRAHSASRVFAQVPSHILDDDLPPLFHFDTARISTPSLDEDESDDAPPNRGVATATASLVMRVSRRVTTAGMWQPARGQEHVEPPATAPTALTITLNMCVSAHYRERAGLDVYRGLHLHVLPGPSYARGSLSALAEAHGAEAIGFEQSFHAMHDHRWLVASAAGETVFRSDALPEASHLPGFGPIPRIRTMSGQHNENWIIYTSGVYDEQRKRVVHDVAIYTLLVHVWNDPMLAKEQLAQQKQAAEPIGATPPPSMNTLGLRVRVSADFAIRPFEFGVATPVRAAGGSTSSTCSSCRKNKEQAAPAPSAAPLPLATPSSTDARSPGVYARIVDLVAYQQRKFVFIGAAFEDGFIRIFSRGGHLRNELHTRNTTVLLIAMSNWGSSATTGSAHGGGAREANAALNGAQNGNQLLAYATDAGIGLVRMARIYSEVEQYCKWDAHAASGIRSGHDLSALSFDAISQSILYLASHADRTLYVLNAGLGREHARFDEKGARIVEPGGNRCAMSAEVAMHLSPAATAISRAFHSPQFDLLSLRGQLFLSSAAAGTLMVFNTSTINDLPRSAGLEFVLERQLLAPPTTTALALHHIRMAQLVADRIDLLVIGAVRNCTLGCSWSSSTGTPTSSTTSALYVLQLFLPQSAYPASSQASYAWLTTSRAPLFLIALLVVFGYHYFQRRKRRHRAGVGLQDDFDPTVRFGSGQRPPLSEHDLMNGVSESASLRRGKGAGVFRSDDSFDSQAFMADFLAWQQSDEGRAAGRTSAPPKGAAYLDLLSRERERARSRVGTQHPFGSKAVRKRPSAIPPSGALGGLAKQRDAIQHRLAALRADAAAMAQAREQFSHEISNFEAATLDEVDPLATTDELYERVGGEQAYDSDDAGPRVHDYQTRDELDHEDEDGPTYHGEYDEYAYDHEEYAPSAGGHSISAHNHTYPIDTVLDDEDEQFDAEPAPPLDDDLVNDEADAAGEGWVDEEEVQAVEDEAVLSRRRHMQPRPE